MPKLATLRGDSLEKAAVWYSQSLHLALPYLEDRGIEQAEAEKYRLGVVAKPCTGHEAYVGRLVIPYLSRAGVVSLRFRSLHDSEPKYLSLKGDKGHLFNVNALFSRGGVIALCEGELDALVLTEYGGVPAVGIAGVNAWSAAFKKCFSDFERVIVVADGDDAGRGMCQRVTDALERGEGVVMPEGEDVNSFFLKEGPEALMEKVLG